MISSYSMPQSIHLKLFTHLYFMLNDAYFFLFVGLERNVCKPFIVCGQQVGLSE